MNIGFILTDEESEILRELCDIFAKTPHEVIMDTLHVLHEKYIIEEDQ